METTTYIIGGTTVTIVDRSSHADRTERLRKPLEAFYLNILKEERKQHEKDNKEKIETMGQKHN